MNPDKEENFKPEEEEIGIIGEITGKNTEGLEKLGSEEKSEEFRRKNRLIRKFKSIYRKYLKKSEASTQKIKA